ncbi:MAG TPA: hypothetical protein VJR68_09630 [Dyella sp.]|nr:hypothetical protein [Dyella sp.]
MIMHGDAGVRTPAYIHSSLRRHYRGLWMAMLEFAPQLSCRHPAPAKMKVFRTVIPAKAAGMTTTEIAFFHGNLVSMRFLRSV